MESPETLTTQRECNAAIAVPLRVLLVEDCQDDAALLIRELKHGGFEVTCSRVDNKEAMGAALKNATWDVVIADFSLPEFSAVGALALLKEAGLDLPFIIVSGAIGEDVAVSMMKAGAHDFILKSCLYRLVPAIQRELQEAAGRAARRQAETHLHETLEKLVRSNSHLDEFAYIASHDLKEPLRGIHNYSVFLLEDYGDKLDEAGKNKLQTLMLLTKRMEELIDELLHFSRISQSRLAVRETNIDMLVHDIIESLQVSIIEQNITVLIPHPLPSVRCDGPRVGEVFRNLIVNAMKYNDKESIMIEIGAASRVIPPHVGSAGRTAAGSTAVTVFYVKDNGIGIQERQFQSVFRMFKRLHAADKYGGGTGVGLAIVKKIVEQHGGVIWIESTVGKGTTFFFTLEGVTNAELPVYFSSATDTPYR